MAEPSSNIFRTPAVIERITAVLNQGIAEAAEIINDVVQTPLLLTPPAFVIRDLAFQTGEEIIHLAEPQGQYRISVVSSTFGTKALPTQGRASVYFSSDRAAKLALLLLTDEASGTDMDSLRNSVFLEIGSILLSGILEQLHAFGTATVFSMPSYTETISDDILTISQVNPTNHIAIMQLECAVESHTIQGRALVMMPYNAWHQLFANIEKKEQ